jgi:hypothetical protein
LFVSNEGGAMKFSTSADLASIQLKVKERDDANHKKTKPLSDGEKVARRSRQILARIFFVEKHCVK